MRRQRKRVTAAAARSCVTVACLAAIACLGWTRDARAQGRAARASGGRFELSGGVGWTGAADLGSAPAVLTGNGAPTGAPVTLFDTETQVESGPRFDGRIAWRWTRTFALEGGLTVTRTHLRTDVDNDFEQAAPTSATSRFTEYAFEGGVVAQVPKLTFAGGRARPFLTGGAGYLRQVHEGATVIDEGWIGFAGGGVSYALHEARGRGFLTAIGLRGDLRLNVRGGGVEIDADRATHIGPSTTASLFLRF